MPKNQQAKDIQEKVIKVLMRDESDRGISELRIASWIVNGKQTPPRLERREKYVLQDTGEERPGKAKGLSMADVELVIKDWANIKPLFLIGPAGSQPAPNQSARRPTEPASRPTPPAPVPAAVAAPTRGPDF